jgi:hypothetical protein
MMPNVMFMGPEDQRVVARSELGVHEDSDEMLVWDKESNIVKIDDEEFEQLKQSAGTWAVVTIEEISSESEAASSESMSDPDQPQAASETSSDSG